MALANAVTQTHQAAPVPLASEPQRAKTDRTLVCVLMDSSRFDRRVVLSLAQSSRYSIEFIETETLAETRDMLAEREADLVVLDSRASDGCGFTFAEALARRARHAAVPVIVLSDAVTTDGALKAIRSGAVDFLAKEDLSADILDRAIEAALRRTSFMPADQRAILSNVQAENETLRRITLRNMRLLKGQVLPLMAFAWRMVGGGQVADEEREEMAKKLARLTRNLTGLVDDTVITAATHRANAQPVPVDINQIISDLINDDAIGLSGSSAHIRVGPLPRLLARPAQMSMLFEELLLTAIRSGRLGQVPEIEIGAGHDPDGNPVIWMQEDGLHLSARKQAMGQRFADLVEPPAETARDEHSWSLCQRIVEKNKGRFKIVENEASGSRVMMRFPKELLMPDDASTTASNAHGPGGDGPSEVA